MTLVPHPGVAPSLGPEVSSAQVVNLGGESEQTPVAVRPIGQVGRAGQAVLFRSTVQHVQGPVLDVGGLLHQCRVQQQVGCGCARREGPR